MPERRRPPQGRTVDLDRFAAGQERQFSALREYMAERFDGISERVERLERDAAAGEIDRATFNNRMGDIDRAFADLRDTIAVKITENSGAAVEAAASGAASGAAAGAAEGAAAGAARGATETIGRVHWLTLGGVAAFVMYSAPQIGHLLADWVRFLIQVAKGTVGTDPN